MKNNQPQQTKLNINRSKLSYGDSKIYIVTRLYDLAEKIKAEYVEKAVLEGVKIGFAELKQPLYKHPTFVPYRDSNLDSSVIDSEDVTTSIYNLDIKRLENSFALIGFFDGLSKDEGVSLEIGFAYGRGKPIILILTDFFKQQAKDNENITYSVDPILLCMTKNIIQKHEIQDGEDEFFDKLCSSFESLLTTLTNETAKLIVQPELYLKESIHLKQKIYTHSHSTFTHPIKVFLDFGGGQFEWQRLLTNTLEEKLNHLGYETLTGSRYNPSALTQVPSKISQADLYLGQKDFTNFVDSDILVVCGDGDEMNCGSAALVGLAKAMGKPILLYDSKSTWICLEDTSWKMSRNFMVSYSCDVIVDRLADIPTALQNLTKIALTKE